MRNKVYYRVGNGSCQVGYQEAVRDCNVTIADIVWDTSIGGSAIPGATVTPAGDCPQEVVIVSAPPAATLKIEFSESLMYSASTELSMFRVREYNEDTGVWSVRYETLAGTPYTGVLPSDLSSVTAQVNVARMVTAGCASGAVVLMRETSRFDAETGAEENTVVDWVDQTGTVLPTMPAGFALGPCAETPPTRRVLIYLERNGGVLNMADIIAATGTDQIQSVTVKQIQGSGNVSADSGSGTPISQGETWSWSAVTSELALDMLGASALSMDAGGGEQRVTATYIV